MSNPYRTLEEEVRLMQMRMKAQQGHELTYSEESKLHDALLEDVFGGPLSVFRAQAALGLPVTINRAPRQNLWG